MCLGDHFDSTANVPSILRVPPGIQYPAVPLYVYSSPLMAGPRPILTVTKHEALQFMDVMLLDKKYCGHRGVIFGNV